jgi:hypothetical protein
MNIESEIARIARSSSDRDTAFHALTALPGANANWSGFIRCQNLEIGVSTNVDGAESAELFRWLRELDIAAAPELTSYPVGAGEYRVDVLRYWICPGERLIPLAQSHVKLSQGARDRFRRDMERLFEHGKMYPYIRGDAHWLVSAQSGAILLSGWLVKDSRPKDREEYFESIERTFARHA